MTREQQLEKALRELVRLKDLNDAITAHDTIADIVLKQFEAGVKGWAVNNAAAWPDRRALDYRVAYERRSGP